jgi:hypothetical protein
MYVWGALRFLGTACAWLPATGQSSDNEFPNDEFFLGIDNLFNNLNIGDNLFNNLNIGDNSDTTDVANVNATAAALNVAPYVFLESMFQLLLEFLVLVFGVYAIDLSCLNDIYSSTLLICMISFITIYVIMLCQLLVRIKSYGNLLMYSTIQNQTIGKWIQEALPQLQGRLNLMVSL